MVSGSIQFWYLGNGFLWTDDKEAACMCRKHFETLGSSWGLYRKSVITFSQKWTCARLLFLNVSTSKSNADRYCVPLFVFPVLFCSCAMRYYISIHIYRTAGNWRVTNDRQRKLLLQTHKGCHHSNGVAELVWCNGAQPLGYKVHCSVKILIQHRMPGDFSSEACRFICTCGL